MFLFKPKRKNNVMVGGYGRIPINETTVLDMHTAEVEGFDGVIVHGELLNFFGFRPNCLQRFKFVVEPLTLLEKLRGITMDDKIEKAVQKMKALSNRFLMTGESSSVYRDLPGMVMGLVK
jgi:hypothetical protein